MAYAFPTHKLCLAGPDTNAAMHMRRMGQIRKTPLVIVACGSYSPITYLHLRMFEMARDHIRDHDKYTVVGGYFSPVSDAYSKPGLCAQHHRIHMCTLATNDSEWLMVDSWEARQKTFVRTASVLDHFREEIDRIAPGVAIMLLAGGDLIQSFAVPNLWLKKDLDHILGDFGCLIVERTGANVHDFLLTNDSLYVHRVN